MFISLLFIIYVSFISLGLPDGLLGAGWPAIQEEMGLSMSTMGMISFIISLGTILSSLQSDRLTKRYGPALVTAVSVAMTALALLGFSISHSLLSLCLWAVPYGLGAGSVDAALNNYVALHYSSKHMSWLHCMWGVGASVGPVIMSNILAANHVWQQGYLIVGLLQTLLSITLFTTIRKWGKSESLSTEELSTPLRLKTIISLPGAKEVMIAFLCYCGLEATIGLWAATYLVTVRGLTIAQAASYASLFYLGITVGRAINGFLAIRFTDSQLIRLGQFGIGMGVVFLLLPFSWSIMSLVALLLLGLGCAPIYPSIIHATPSYFGKDKSQAIIGVQMASAYVGTTLLPPLFGLFANYVTPSLFAPYLLIILYIMYRMHERLIKQSSRSD